jgi:hypothetical protein
MVVQVVEKFVLFNDEFMIWFSSNYILIFLFSFCLVDQMNENYLWNINASY